MKSIWLSLILLANMTGKAFAASDRMPTSNTLKQYYISPTGDDQNDGSEQSPLRSIHKAQQLATPHFGKSDIQFLFMDGIHYLDSCIRIAPEQSGTKQHTVTYAAVHSGKASLSGGRSLTLHWSKYKGNICQAKVKGIVADIDQLYVNGRRKPMARYPNIVEGKNVFDCWELSHSIKPNPEKDVLNPQRIASWKNPEGAYIHAMHKAIWGDMHWLVKGKNNKGELISEGGWQNNRPSPMHPVYRIVENVFEELDSPGEWYYDRKTSTLYYWPEQDEDMTRATVETVVLKELVRFSGTKETPVSHITLRGLTFRHVARTFMDNKEPLLRSDWTIYRGGTITLNGTVSCMIDDCEFDQVGGNAIFVNNYNRNLLIKGCYIHECGSNGIAFVGDPATVRSPLFRYAPQNYETIDRTRGPQGDNYPANCRVEECLITQTGRFEKQTAPVQISMSHKITASHCSIYDVPRAGINISEGTFGGHVIEYCDVFNTVLETSDHGSFNSWGRDRYWTPEIKETSLQVEQDTLLPWLDTLDEIILRNNRWRCDHGWDIDLDDGSSHYRIYNNLLLNGGLKLREGYNRIATNNVIINNTLHPHVWYRNSGDVFKYNIIFSAYKAIGMQASIPANEKWGKEIDYNMFVTDEQAPKTFNGNGCDLHSIAGNPQFYDEKSGDFRIQASFEDKGFLFRNFSMDNFGVTLPKLRRIAKTPEIPPLQIAKESKGKQSVTSWYGATIKNIETLGEQSAIGLENRCGILLISIPQKSPLSAHGLQVNDVILEVQGKKICNVDDLQQMDADNGDLPLNLMLTIWRNQEKVEININR